MNQAATKIQRDLPIIYLVVLVLFFTPPLLTGQIRHVATTGAAQAVSSTKTTPALTVLGQNAVGRLSTGPLTVFTGIDYIRMFSRASATVYVYLPDTTVAVGEHISIPVIVQKAVEQNTVPSVRNVEVEFRYKCEVLDLFDVSETSDADGYCTARFTAVLSKNDVDTFWIDGVSKLCSVTSTPLSAIRASALADRGRVAVVVTNGEVRQSGHCVTDGDMRLIFSPVGITVFPYPASGSVHVKLEGFRPHNGSLQLIDLRGGHVSVIGVKSGADGTFSTLIDLNGLTSGTYSLHYIHEHGVSNAVVQVVQ